MLLRPPIKNETATLAPLVAPRSLIVDVGSTQGAFFSSFLEAGCKVISVEPNLRNVLFQHSRFHSEVASGRLTIYHRGCSDIQEERTLYINDDFEGSLSNFNDCWKKEFPSAFSHGLEEVHDLIPLRELLRPHADEMSPFSLLKVDSDGFDLKILRGYFYDRGALPMPKLVLCGISAQQEFAEYAQYCVDLLAQLRFDRFKLFVHRGATTVADSPWLTHPQLARFGFTTINDSLNSSGEGFRRATMLVTSSTHLAEQSFTPRNVYSVEREHA